MSSLWLSLGRTAPSCRCISCLSHKAVQPTNFAAAKSSRNRLTILFYSSVISTAAAADVKHKQSRRRELDEQIAELELSLQQTRRVEKQDATTPLQDDVHTIQDKPHPPSYPKNIRPTGIASGLGQTKIVEELLLQPSETCSHGRLLSNRGHIVPWTRHASPEHRRRSIKPWSEKKQLVVQYSVAKLVTNLLLGVTGMSPSQRSKLDEARNSYEQQLRVIRQSSVEDCAVFPKLQYPQYSPDSPTIENGSHQLNASLKKIFKKWLGRRLETDEAITMLAHNLLASSVAPDIVTYVILISRLSRFRGFVSIDLADCATESLFETHIRHNTQSIHAILQHYRRRNKHEAFHRAVLKLQGFYGGLQRAHPDTNTGPSNVMRYKRWDDKIIETVDIDERLSRTIVSGYERMSYSRSKSEWLNFRNGSGFSEDITSLLRQLSKCVEQGLWDIGHTVWKEIQCQVLDPTGPCVRRQDELVAHNLLLKLMRKAGKSPLFREHYESALSRGFNMAELLLEQPLISWSWTNSHPQYRLLEHIQNLRARLSAIAQDLHFIALEILATKIVFAGSGQSLEQTSFYEYVDKDVFISWRNGKLTSNLAGKTSAVSNESWKDSDFSSPELAFGRSQEGPRTIPNTDAIKTRHFNTSTMRAHKQFSKTENANIEALLPRIGVQKISDAVIRYTKTEGPPSYRIRPTALLR